jgi:hypothetical protein
MKFSLWAALPSNVFRVSMAAGACNLPLSCGQAGTDCSGLTPVRKGHFKNNLLAFLLLSRRQVLSGTSGYYKCRC